MLFTALTTWNYKAKLFDWVQSKSYPVIWVSRRWTPINTTKTSNGVYVFFYIYIYIFLSIKPQRKWLNWLKGQADVAAHKYNLWEWSDLWVFVCFRVAESLKDGFILQEEVVSAALCSWKRGGACPYSSLPGVRYTLGSLDSQVSWRNWNSHEPHCHGLINRPWHE